MRRLWNWLKSLVWKDASARLAEGATAPLPDGPLRDLAIDDLKRGESYRDWVAAQWVLLDDPTSEVTDAQREASLSWYGQEYRDHLDNYLNRWVPPNYEPPRHHKLFWRGFDHEIRRGWAPNPQCPPPGFYIKKVCDDAPLEPIEPGSYTISFDWGSDIQVDEETRKLIEDRLTHYFLTRGPKPWETQIYLDSSQDNPADDEPRTNNPDTGAPGAVD